MMTKPRILFVEDEPLLGELMSEALTDRGFAVHVASSAGEALDYLRSDEPIDALITDIDLGEGLDGAAVALFARRLRPGLAVIYASGRTRQEISEIVAGAKFLRKPYTLKDVESLFGQLVPRAARRRPRPEPASHAAR